jgi:hypothetical protein
MNEPVVGDLRTVTQRFDGEQWVLCLQSIPPRELSDEEIVELIPIDPPIDGAICGSVEGLLVFARAILKKASEK